MLFITEHIKLLLILSAGLISVIVFIMLSMMRKKYIQITEAENYQENKIRFLENSKERIFRLNDEKTKEKYRRTETFLRTNGVYYQYKNQITPIEYYAIRFIFAFLFAVAAMLFNVYLIPVGALLGLIMPSYLVRSWNESDNNKMLNSIKDVYDTIRIQTRDNVYITNALYECYLTASHPRLKAALHELTNEINGSGNIETALTHFSEKFSNPYIESLATSIKQALVTGQKMAIFTDISKQIDAIDEAILIREREKAEMLNTIVQALVYVGIMAFVLYVTIMSAAGIFDIF